MSESRIRIVWTEYMKYRARLRRFDLDEIEQVVRYSSERYIDTATGRLIAVGRIGEILVIVPCDIEQETIIPVTIHATTRQQINFRITTRRFINE